MMKTHDNHHLLNTNRQWSSEPIGRRLREQPSLIYYIDRPTHEEIHANVPPVPLLGHHALLGTFNRYQPTYDVTKDIDGLCLAIDRTVRGERFHSLERNLAGLAIESIQLQKPYIFDGMAR